jgi:hypothetical protein
MWYDAMRVIQNYLPDATFTPPNGNDINGVLTTVPDVGGLPYDQAAQRLQQAGFTVADGGVPRLRLRAGHGGVHRPGRRLTDRQWHHGDDLPVRRNAVRPAAPPPPPRWRQRAGNGMGTVTATTSPAAA